jgi:pimeloyl-ACP methyl ester carboxylesterase
VTIAETFLLAGVGERAAMLRDDGTKSELSRLLGEKAYAELRKVADQRFGGHHLGDGGPRNMIFVPGIMGTLLMNTALAGIWWIDVRTRNSIDKLGLAPDGIRDADGREDVTPATADPTYMPFLMAVQVEPGLNHAIFPYDWRKSPLQSAAAFRDLVLKLHQENGGQKGIHIVAHSLGGLMIRAALMQHPELWPKIGKIVFIGTPHYGATAIAGYLKNHLWGFELMALLGNYLSRATLRSLWGVISLLPAPHGIYPGTRPGDPHPWQSGDPADPYVHPCVNFNLYRADAWKLDLDAGETAKLQTILDATADFHRRMYQAHGDLDQTHRDKMVVIAGVGFETLFRLAYTGGLASLWKTMTKVFGRVDNDPHRDGDGRVPLASARLENVFDTRYVYGVHGGLTNIPDVYNDVFRYLKAKPMQLPRTVAQALSGHLAGPVASEAPHLDGSASAPAFSNNPGLWNLDGPSPDRMTELENMLEADQLPGFARIRLL